MGDLHCSFLFFKGQNYKEFNLFYCTSFKVRGFQHLFMNRKFKRKDKIQMKCLPAWLVFFATVHHCLVQPWPLHTLLALRPIKIWAKISNHLLQTVVMKTELHCMCKCWFWVQFCSVLRRHGSSFSVLSPSPLQNEVNAIKWDPTGNLLASCSDDMTLKVGRKRFAALPRRSQTNLWLVGVLEMRPLKPSIQPEQSSAVNLIASPLSVHLVKKKKQNSCG